MKYKVGDSVIVVYDIYGTNNKTGLITEIERRKSKEFGHLYTVIVDKEEYYHWEDEISLLTKLHKALS